MAIFRGPALDAPVDGGQMDGGLSKSLSCGAKTLEIPLQGDSSVSFYHCLSPPGKDFSILFSILPIAPIVPPPWCYIFY